MIKGYFFLIVLLLKGPTWRVEGRELWGKFRLLKPKSYSPWLLWCLIAARQTWDGATAFSLLPLKKSPRVMPSSHCYPWSHAGEYFLPVVCSVLLALVCHCLPNPARVWTYHLFFFKLLSLANSYSSLKTCLNSLPVWNLCVLNRQSLVQPWKVQCHGLSGSN